MLMNLFVLNESSLCWSFTSRIRYYLCKKLPKLEFLFPPYEKLSAYDIQLVEGKQVLCSTFKTPEEILNEIVSVSVGDTHNFSDLFERRIKKRCFSISRSTQKAM